MPNSRLTNFPRKSITCWVGWGPVNVIKWPYTAHRADVRSANNHIVVTVSHGSSGPKVLSKLSQSCIKVAQKLSQSCLQVAQKLAQSCLKVALKIAKLSESCLKLVPNWGWVGLSDLKSCSACGSLKSPDGYRSSWQS